MHRYAEAAIRKIIMSVERHFHISISFVSDLSPCSFVTSSLRQAAHVDLHACMAVLSGEQRLLSLSLVALLWVSCLNVQQLGGEAFFHGLL